MPPKPHFIWPPPGDENKQFHNEVAAPAAILQALGADITVGPPRENLAQARLASRPKSLEEWLDTKGSDAGGLILGGGRSWNHPQLLMAARGLVFGDWGDAGKLMAMQAGRIPGEGMAAVLDGEEPRSTDYDPYRWAAELIFASDKAPAEIRADAREVLRRQLGLALLGAVEWTDEGDEFRNARGELFYRGPTLSPVGERSPKTSNPDLLGLFCRLALGRDDLCDREGWACTVADIVGAEALIEPQILSPFDDPNLALKLLGDAKAFGEFRFVEYPEGRLVMRPKQLNSNTPSALWSFADHVTKRQVRGFPFDPSKKNRGEGAPTSVGCTIEEGEVVARSTDDHFTARFRLPTSMPLWSIVVDGQGARFETGGAQVPPPSQPPVEPPPVVPPPVVPPPVVPPPVVPPPVVPPPVDPPPVEPPPVDPPPVDPPPVEPPPVVLPPVVPPPVIPPPVIPPPVPAVDIEALVAEVIALSAQDDPTNAAVALVRAEEWQKASEAVAGLMVPKKRVPARKALAARLADLAEDE
jgi:hypothetical protein